MTRHGAYYHDIVPYLSRYHDKGKFGRMFPNLPAFAPDNKKVRDALKEMGAKGGIMDAKDDMSVTPAELITRLDKQQNNPNSPTMTAGATFLGQFIDHDITFALPQNPFWKPCLDCFEKHRSGRDFTMADMIKLAEA